jgi:predicted RNase H-like HicB family nuclease
MAHQEAVGINEYSYTVILEPSEVGGYTVTCPALPGVVTEGDTLEEAREMAADAILCYLESLQKDGLPIPVEHEHQVESAREKVTAGWRYDPPVTG